MPDIPERLIDAYELLKRALPLALESLCRGGIDPIDQGEFWRSYHKISRYMDLTYSRYVSGDDHDDMQFWIDELKSAVSKSES